MGRMSRIKRVSVKPRGSLGLQGLPIGDVEMIKFQSNHVALLDVVVFYILD